MRNLGLDSVSAAKVARVLYDVAHDLESPTAVIASIHQPRCVSYYFCCSNHSPIIRSNTVLNSTKHSIRFLSLPMVKLSTRDLAHLLRSIISIGRRVLSPSIKRDTMLPITCSRWPVIPLLASSLCPALRPTTLSLPQVSTKRLGKVTVRLVWQRKVRPIQMDHE